MNKAVDSGLSQENIPPHEQNRIFQLKNRISKSGRLLGGSGADGGVDLALDSAGNAYITGSTDSSNFPTVAGSFDTTVSGVDAFIAKINDRSPPSIRIVSITKNGNSILLQGVGVPSAIHKVQATDDLSQPFNPNPIGTPTADSNGNFQFIDTIALMKRFYRVVYP